MECHYKVLGVELNADDDVIKRAYRKAALKYHPDKNLHCLEEATEKFRLVQAAYDVLSDPQERAWYDRHREEILHRKKYENYKENSLDLWDYFSPSAYKGFGDDENGFYAVYRDVFKKIDAEDQPFRDEGVNDEWMPNFGHSESNYDEVVHEFYSSWQSYCTQLSYVWEAQYDVKEAPNRRVARIIEKENKKERDKHKKKRNELVRELVSFVRKRDPRVKEHKAKLERIAEEQAVKAEERRMSAMRAKVKEAALYDEANKEELIKHHKRVSELENMMKDEFGFSSSDEESEKSENDSEEEYSDDVFCVACNKLFKSHMGMRNHQKSKKHKENMNRLKQEMYNDSADNEEDVIVDEKLADVTEEENMGEKKLTKKQKKRNKQQQKLLSNTMESEPLKLDNFKENGDGAPETISTSKVSTNCNNEPAVQLEVPHSMAETILNSATTENIEGRAQEEETPNEKSKTKKNRQKKKAQPKMQNLESSAESLGCGKCSQVFPSRNKLFQHLKKTGHSLPVEAGKSSKRKNARNGKN